MKLENDDQEIAQGEVNSPQMPGLPPGAMIPIRTLFQVLLGCSEAILTIAATPSALGVGALLVLSAGLARNYDKPELWTQPWRLLGSFGASLATSGLLFLVVYGVAALRRMRRPGIVRGYRAFLTVYWATAPLAWFYGIPFERYLSPLQATKANVAVLALVSAWRVALMIRATSLLIAVPALLVVPVVLLVEEVIAWSAIVFSPVPIIQVMGGTDPQVIFVSDVAIFVLMVITVTAPINLILGGFAADSWKPTWSVPDVRPARSTGRLFLFAAASVIVWAILAVAHR